MNAGKLMVYKMSLALAGVLLIAGILLVAVETGHAPPGRYLMPAQILPGVSVLYLGTMLAAWGIAKSGPHAMKDLYAWIFQRTSKEHAAKGRNLFLMLTVVIVTAWTLDGSPPALTGHSRRILQYARRTTSCFH
jgi:hypothetical protein